MNPASPRIETARLLLRPMVAGDVQPLLRVFADPVVMASFGGTVFSEQDMMRWIDRNLRHQDRFGYGLFSVVHKGGGEVIGDCGLEHEEGVTNDAELGYDLASRFWGQGLATEAAIAVRDYAFGVLDLARLHSMIREGNHASRRVAEKAGMHLDATIERGSIVYWRYAVLREEVGGHTGAGAP